MTIQNTDSLTIHLTINNKQETLAAGTIVSQLLSEKNMKARSAVWINGRQLLQSEYDQWTLQEGDQVKLLRILAGG